MVKQLHDKHSSSQTTCRYIWQPANCMHDALLPFALILFFAASTNLSFGEGKKKSFVQLILRRFFLCHLRCSDFRANLALGRRQVARSFDLAQTENDVHCKMSSCFLFELSNASEIDGSCKMGKIKNKFNGWRKRLAKNESMHFYLAIAFVQNKKKIWRNGRPTEARTNGQTVENTFEKKKVNPKSVISKWNGNTRIHTYSSFFCRPFAMNERKLIVSQSYIYRSFVRWFMLLAIMEWRRLRSSSD